jgi:hypothetical protein
VTRVSPSNSEDYDPSPATAFPDSEPVRVVEPHVRLRRNARGRPFEPAPPLGAPSTDEKTDQPITGAII